MEISCRGAARREYNHKICSEDLSKLEIGQYAGHSEKDFGVNVRWRKRVRLGGNYKFVAVFSQKDVARLFVEAFAGATLGDMLNALAAAQEAREDAEH